MKAFFFVLAAGALAFLLSGCFALIATTRHAWLGGPPPL